MSGTGLTDDYDSTDTESIYEDAPTELDGVSSPPTKAGTRKALRRGVRKAFNTANRQLNKVQIRGERLGLEKVSDDTSHNVQKQFGGVIRKETINDLGVDGVSGSGAQVVEYRALKGLATYTEFKTRDESGNLRRSEKEEKLLGRKSVKYGPDQDKEISRGTRHDTASISYEKIGKKRAFTGLKLGPLSISRHKGKDGSYDRKISLGPFSYAIGMDARGNKSVAWTAGNQFASKVTRDREGQKIATYSKLPGNISRDWKRDDYGNTEVERNFTKFYASRTQSDTRGKVTYSSKTVFGRSIESRHRPDGSSVRLSTRGTDLQKLERMEPSERRAALRKDINLGNIRHYEVTGADGKTVSKYKKSRLGLGEERFTRGVDGKHDEVTRDVTGLKSTRSIAISQSQKDRSQAVLDRSIWDIASPGGEPQAKRIDGETASVAKEYGMPTRLANKLDVRIREAASRTV